MKPRKAKPQPEAQPVETPQVAPETVMVRLSPNALLPFQQGYRVPYEGYVLTTEWQPIPREVVEVWLSRVGKGHGVPPLEVAEHVPDAGGV